MHFANITVPLTVCLLAVSASGCGGSKVVKNHASMPVPARPLSVAADQRISANLDWIIVKNAPEAWAKNADWDEYIYSIRSLPGHSVQVTDIAVYDSLDFKTQSLADRKALKAGSKATVERYKAVELAVKPGVGTLGIVAGSTAGVMGAGSIAAATTSSGLWGGAALAGAATVVLIMPVVGIAGIVRAVHHSKVDQGIKLASAQLPLAVTQEAPQVLHLFYPFTPSPKRIEISYTDSQGSHLLTMDTAALAGLHLNEPDAKGQTPGKAAAR